MTIARRSVSTCLASAALAAAAVGCASPSGATKAASDPSPEAAEHAHIVAVHKAKCGACHTRVEPGTRSRQDLEAALKRHRSRAKLSEREWAELVDYLAADGGANGRDAARTP